MKKKKIFFFQLYTLEMTNKISNVNTTDPHNKVYINEAYLLIITIKHNYIKQLSQLRTEKEEE